MEQNIEDPVIQKLLETNRNDVEKITQDISNKFDVTSESSDQDAVTSKRTTMSEKGDTKVG